MNEKDNTSKFCLDNVIDISCISTLKDSLSSLTTNAELISIDASQVERIDTAGLQLLLSFIKKMEIKHSAVNFISPSNEFVSAIKTLGLENSFSINQS